MTTLTREYIERMKQHWSNSPYPYALSSFKICNMALEVEKLTRDRDALLVALKIIEYHAGSDATQLQRMVPPLAFEYIMKARAAINAVEATS